MNIITNYLSEKKDVVRANNSVNTVIALKDLTTGEFYTSISPTVLSSTQAIIEAYEKEEILNGIEVIVKSKKSNNGRDFYYIDLV